MRPILFCTLILTLLACEKTEQMSIPEDKMVKIMSDMLLAEAAINRLNRGQADSIEQLYYNQIYTIHGIDSLEFAENLQMMSMDPQISFNVYEKVQERMEGKLNDLREEEKKEKEEKKQEAKNKKSETTKQGTAKPNPQKPKNRN